MNNRIDGYSYDAAGNVIGDGTHTYTYDAENRLTKVDAGNTAVYTYDGEGHRASKDDTGSVNSGGNVPDPAGTTEFVYDPQGHLVHTEAPNSGVGWRGEVFAGNRHLASYANGNLIFAHADWLGTERNRDLPNPNAPQYPSNQNITSLPFGDWLDNTQGIVSDWTPLDFTGQYHDFETDLDYFGARYYAPSTGRFTSPDPAGIFVADTSFPQSWNLYSYVRNNPLNYIDPNGLDCAYLNDAGNAAESIDSSSNIGECEQNGGYWANGSINQVSWVQPNVNNDTAVIYSQLDNGGIGVSLASQTWTQGAFGLSDEAAQSIYSFEQWIPQTSSQLALQAIHDGLQYLPAVCTIGISARIGGKPRSELNSTRIWERILLYELPIGHRWLASGLRKEVFRAMERIFRPLLSA